MIRLFQFVILLLGLSLVALASAILTMRFAIHGAEIKIPDFKGMTPSEALQKASDMGVEMTVDNRFYSAEVPAGRIVSQSPAPGTTVRREWHIHATEILGPQLVGIPNVVGEQQRNAVMQIRRMGMELGEVARMPFTSAMPGMVIAQDPPAGAAGVEKPSISVVIGDAGPAATAQFVMPDFIGRQYATAVATIARAGLKLSPMSETASSTGVTAAVPPSPGTVVSQSPPAGYYVDSAQLIELTVAR
jgi:eukaryotic-like serine/threonine-protein kinase